MAFMEWSSQYGVGVAIFDDEHKKLVAIINELHAALAAGADKPALEKVIDHLIEYTLMHFRHEEMYFDDWVYPDAQAHIASHTRLRAQVFDFRKAVMARDAREVGTEMADFLRHWLLDHIQDEDKRYGAFLTQKGLR